MSDAAASPAPSPPVGASNDRGAKEKNDRDAYPDHSSSQLLPLIDPGGLMAYLSEGGYSIVRHPLLGSSLAPLCCLMARKIPDERTAARQATVRAAQLDDPKVKKE